MTTLPSSFSFGSFLSFGWETFQQKIGVLLKFIAIYFVLIIIPNMLIGGLKDSPLSLIVAIAGAIWQMVLAMGFMKVVLNVIDEKPVEVSTLWSSKHLLGRYVWANIRLTVQVMIGFFLLVIPGVIWAIQYQFVPLLIVDKELSADEAFKKSKEMTDGKKMSLFLYSLGFGLVNIGGMLLLGLGLLVTAPVTALAMIGIYRYLESNSGSRKSSKPVEEGQVIA